MKPNEIKYQTEKKKRKTKNYSLQHFYTTPHSSQRILP